MLLSDLWGPKPRPRLQSNRQLTIAPAPVQLLHIRGSVQLRMPADLRCSIALSAFPKRAYASAAARWVPALD